MAEEKEASKFIQVYKIAFTKDSKGIITKNYEGILKSEDHLDVEAGISVVIQHLYLHQLSIKTVFGMKYCEDSLFEIIISKNSLKDFRVESAAGEITPTDCENIITGLGELLLKLHLKRLVKTGVVITLNKEDRTSFTPKS